MNYDTFIDEFKPVKNHLTDAPYDGLMFETYGNELEFIASDNHISDKKVWTIIDGGGADLILVSGFWRINRIGYFITEKPFDGESGDIEITL